jgi:predicted nucleotidyltransferase
MLISELIKALKIINQKLRGKKIKWVLVGSTSLALQGVKIKPKDIDILIDKKSILKVNKLFREYEVEPIKFTRSKFFESYIGEFRIEGIKVEVMANLKEKIGNKWTSFSGRLINPRIIAIQGMGIPVSPLKEQLKSYQKLNRKKDLIRVQKIKDALKNHSN